MYNYTQKEKQGVLKVKISAEEWEKALDRTYEKNKGKYNVQGFRKGKVPRKVIEKTYGDTVFFEDTFNDMIGQEFSKFLSENHDVKPAAMPEVSMDNYTADKGVEATLTFDLMPEVKLGALTALKAKKATVKVDAKQVESELQKLKESHVRYIEKNKACQNGDIATIDFVGSIDGKKFEGGTGENYRLELGSHTFIDGFEDQVVGMKVGDKKDVNVTFPENYGETSLQGKPAVFAVTVKKVEEKELPVIDDKFISDTTEFENLEEYKKSVKEKLVEEAERKANYDYETALVDEVVAASSVEIPHAMIHEEAHHMMHEFEHRLSHQNMTLETYLQYTGSTMEAFHANAEKDAEKTLKTRLVLQKIIADKNIKVEQADIDAKMAEYAKQYGVSVEEMQKNISREDVSYFENEILMEKIFALLKQAN